MRNTRAVYKQLNMIFVLNGFVLLTTVPYDLITWNKQVDKNLRQDHSVRLTSPAML